MLVRLLKATKGLAKETEIRQLLAESYGTVTTREWASRLPSSVRG